MAAESDTILTACNSRYFPRNANAMGMLSGYRRAKLGQV